MVKPSKPTQARKVRKIIALDHAMLREIEDYRRTLRPIPAEAEAIRRLIALGLDAAPAASPEEPPA